jgi:WD40 repeat protein
VRLWEVATGRCLRTFGEHTGWVQSVCLSGDGRYALSGSEKSVRLLHVESWTKAASIILSRFQAVKELLAAEAAHDQALQQALQALARGKSLEAAQLVREARTLSDYKNSQKAINLWADLYLHLPHKQLRGGWKERRLQGHTGQVWSVCLSGDGRYALSGSEDRSLRLWEVTTGRCLRTFEGHTDPVKSVCLSGDGRYALSGSWDKSLRLWEVASGRCLRTFEGHTEKVTSVCLSGDGRYALSGSWDDSLRLWEATTGRLLRTFGAHGRQVQSVCFSGDGRYAVSGSGGFLRLWEVATGRNLRTFEGHTGGVQGVCLSGDGRYALSGTAADPLWLHEVATGRCLRTFEGPAGMGESVYFSRDGRYALSGSRDDSLRLWEVVSGRCLHTFEGHTEKVISVCLSGDGRYALSGSNDTTLILWFLDWELEDKQPADWNEEARPYLDMFLYTHTPYAATLPNHRQPTEEEVTLALTRRGKPTWSDDDFKQLLYTLGCAGYGWLRPEGVRRELERMASAWQGPPPRPQA